MSRNTAAVPNADARPMRRDAVRNQQAVLTAARAVLSEYGTEATMELIATQAGVGVGTVYRHFPNKDALIDALVGSIFAQLVDDATSALEHDDGSGLERFLRILGESFAEHRGYARMLVGYVRANCGADHLRRQITELVEQAKAGARVGAWVTVGDVMALIWAMRGVVETSAAVAPSAWERHLEIHLAALGAPAAPSGRPGLTGRQLARIASETG